MTSLNTTCTHCGKTLGRHKVVLLELDQRTGTYHNFRDVPMELSQGWFDFGPDCARKLIAAEKKRRQDGSE